MRALRLGSGLILFAYIALHLICHALGLNSLASAEAALRLSLKLWHSLPGSILLYGAAAIHFGLALQVVVLRPSLRMPLSHLIRFMLGFAIPLLLIGHVVSTRLAWEIHAAEPTYARVVSGLFASGGEGRQLALLVPGWVHGCMGLYFASVGRTWFQRLRPLLVAASVFLPLLAAAGFFSMAGELTIPADAPAATARRLSPMQQADLASWRQFMLNCYFGLIALVVALRLLRRPTD